MGVEPTKLTACIRVSSSMVSTATLSPLTTLNTPSGKPASLNSWPINMPTLGSRSDGFRMNVLPHAMAMGNIHIGTMAGKLNGVIPATTPKGWNSDQLSIAGPTFLLCSPFNKLGAPQAYSTTSIPRMSSPWASSSTLPCSLVSAAQILSALSSKSCLKRNITRARLRGGVLRHAGKAASAALIASSTVALLAKATWRSTKPVAGLKTSCTRWVSATIAPLIKCPTTCILLPRCRYLELLVDLTTIVPCPSKKHYWLNSHMRSS